MRMIFHVPYPLDPAATSASGIRPVRMRRAFESIGYEVVEISGWAAERRQKIREVRRRIRSGERFEFVYSEASTMPTALTEPHHFPTHPFLDLNFLKFCRYRGIPVGVFYRDIYWNEPAYLESVNRIVALGTRALYRFDLFRYRSAVSRIFVPSLTMAKTMPLTKLDQCTPLPPAADVVEAAEPTSVASMFYVGALGTYYRLHEAVRAVSRVPGAVLTICTRQALWEKERGSYEAILSDGSTNVVHASGEELRPHYDRAALGCLFMEPIAYREFAAPLKLYEYLGYGRPVIAVEGSHAARFVEEHQVGWVLPYQASALEALLTELLERPEKYFAAVERVRQVREEHTWEARAQQAAAALTAGTAS